MELTTVERLKLLETLPAEGNIMSLKILRKLRETLSFTEEELKSIGALNEYACPFYEEVNNAPVSCDNKGFFPIAPKCADHNILMVPTGNAHFDLSPEMQAKIKDIHMGPQALTIASEALKRLNENERLTEAHISLYEKFFPPEEKTEE